MAINEQIFREREKSHESVDHYPTISADEAKQTNKIIC